MGTLGRTIEGARHAAREHHSRVHRV